jgi:hypothetical protein
MGTIRLYREETNHLICFLHKGLASEDGFQPISTSMVCSTGNSLAGEDVPNKFLLPWYVS